jgi:hypothetical protein
MVLICRASACAAGSAAAAVSVVSTAPAGAHSGQRHNLRRIAANGGRLQAQQFMAKRAAQG